MMLEMEQVLERKPETESSSPGTVTDLAITGMSCGGCARNVIDALQSVPGVRAATVSLDTMTATVLWNAAAHQDVPGLVHAVEEAGYGAKAVEAHTHEEGQRRLAGWQLTLWVGMIGTVPLMLGEWVFRFGGLWFQWISFVLAGIVQVVAGARFYRGAWNQLKAGSSNMDTLVALGSSTAFLYSVWVLFSGFKGHLYFMEAAAIITLVSLGHWMESRVSLRASSALRKLLDLAPRRAQRLNEDGSQSEVAVTELHVSERVVLRAGDRVPTDGVVLEGQSAVDESMLTGEAVPVDKAPGSALYAGTVNLNGRLAMRVAATGEQTALAQIVAAVQRAQTSRANIQRLADRVSNVFVPIVVLIAFGASLWWGLAPETAERLHHWLSQWLWHVSLPEGLAVAFIIPAAVLIIACPCAMGLATPAAIMAGSNAAAERGVLIRDGVALEKAGQITAVLFDKTGTITVGKPSAALYWQPASASGATAFSPEQFAASLARHSTHPISQAVAKLCSDNEVHFRDVQEIRGNGVQANWDGEPKQIVRFGSLRWLRESGVELTPALQGIESAYKDGLSLVGLALDGSLRGLFTIRDSIKPGAREVIAQLEQQGLKIYLITGDSSLAASRVAKEVGIAAENVFAEVRPEQKAELVQKLQQQGERIAFVGDGINDAPALEQADLGIAVSRASDIAREAADIILLNSEIEAVPESLGLAQATLRTIKQNLFWAFFYNALAVPLAALGFISPVLCAAAMGLSDLVVIGNALRLRRWRLAV